jgi:hypothetical protein
VADDGQEPADPGVPGQPAHPGQQYWQILPVGQTPQGGGHLPPVEQAPDTGHRPRNSRSPWDRRFQRKHPWLVLIATAAVISAIKLIPAQLSEDSENSGSQPSGTTTAALGSAITLDGITVGEQVTVTAVRVINSATSSDPLFAPPAGERYYAVQFSLDNTGSVTYAEDANFEATVIDSAGKSYTPDLFDTVSGCPAFTGTGTMSPGSSLTGCVVFDLPTVATAKEIQYVPDSGQGPQIGQWPVGG